MNLSERPIKHKLSPIIRLLLLSFLLLLPICGHAQMLFPELLPPDATLVLSVPQTETAWQAFESMPIVKTVESLLQKPGETTAPGTAKGPAAMAGPLPIDAATLFGAVLSSTELAVAPARSIAGGHTLLWIGKVKDLPQLRKTVEQLEESAAKRAESPKNPVTRTTEGIGDTTLKFLTDQKSTVGYFINGPHSLWALSNDPETLREAARKLAKQGLAAPVKEGTADADKAGDKKSATEKPDSEKTGKPESQVPLARAVWAFQQLKTASPKAPFHVRFFMAPSSDTQNSIEALGRQAGLGALDPLLKALTPQGPTAGGLRFDRAAIRVESLSLYAPGDPSAALYKSATPLQADITAPFAAPNPLIEGGNCLLDVKLMKRYLLGAVGSMPRGQQLGESARRTQERLTPLQQWARDPNLFSELGPTWFFALNDFAFQEPGQFPKIDFLLGFETQNPEATRKAMLQLEAAMLKAGADYIRDQAMQAPAAIPTTASLMVDQRVEKMPDAEVTIRYFSSPKMPDSLRPAWAIYKNRLLIDLSPEMLAQALQRTATPGNGAEAFQAMQHSLGVDNFHTFQIVRFQRAARVLTAILLPIVRKANPDAVPLVSSLAQVLQPIDTMAFFRKGTDAGVQTIGEIRMAK